MNIGTNFDVYGDSSDLNFAEKWGFATNEIFEINVWDADRGCLVEMSDFGTTSNKVFYEKDRADTLVVWMGQNSQISYPETEFCNSRTDTIKPQFFGKIANPNFVVSRNGLNFNPANGEIYTTGSKPGKYTLYFKTQSCLAMDSVVFTVANSRVQDPYNLTTICKTSTLAITSNLWNQKLKYSSNTLIIDSLSGKIDYQSAVVGKHFITVFDSICNFSYQDSIDVSDSVYAINYPDLICSTTERIMPLGKTDELYVSFFVDNPNLAYDVSTGVVYPNVSDVGEYIVLFESASCLSKTSDTIFISNDLQEISYPQNLCNTNGGRVLPQSNKEIKNVKFTSTNALDVDFETGGINLNQDLAGSYQIDIQSDSVCLVSNSVDFTLKIGLTFNPSLYLIEPSNCPEDSLGSIRRDPSKSPLSQRPIVWTLYDTEMNRIDSVRGFYPNFSQLKSNDYKIKVTNSNGCESLGNFRIDSVFCPLVYTDLVTDLNVLNPNSSSSLYNQAKFNCDGELKIYNRNAKLVRKLNGNDYWRGEDDNSQPLPSGLYIIFCDDKKIGEITLVYGE
jgi:hypothetical protein